MTEKEQRALIFCLDYIAKFGHGAVADAALQFKVDLDAAGTAVPATIPATTPTAGEPTDPLA